jgi:CubicO group peptidase (beta-lactamase class C family)
MLFPPGQVPAYSLWASLAGYIVQRVGEPFERYIERHILVPLGMAHTTFDQPLPERLMAAASRATDRLDAPESI